MVRGPPLTVSIPTHLYVSFSAMMVMRAMVASSAARPGKPLRSSGDRNAQPGDRGSALIPERGPSVDSEAEAASPSRTLAVQHSTASSNNQSLETSRHNADAGLQKVLTVGSRQAEQRESKCLSASQPTALEAFFPPVAPRSAIDSFKFELVSLFTGMDLPMELLSTSEFRRAISLVSPGYSTQPGTTWTIEQLQQAKTAISNRTAHQAFSVLERKALVGCHNAATLLIDMSKLTNVHAVADNCELLTVVASVWHMGDEGVGQMEGIPLLGKSICSTDAASIQGAIEAICTQGCDKLRSRRLSELGTKCGLE
ncbi:hypothetical protein FOZ60_011856 [Perkinsus olseni]|uniref:Uncharacterized protein n=1 Tax=Perkinsus olseni TaxID=32597 RepID=A0A7J6PAJ0_PEROL|nr:hypothetical protein FOZ60_011856 [Perkinsus olseni]